MTPQLHCEIPPLRLLTQLLWPTLFICGWKACDQSADSIHTRPGTVKYTQHHDQPEGPGRFSIWSDCSDNSTLLRPSHSTLIGQ